jgi:hypothetical protein
MLRDRDLLNELAQYQAEYELLSDDEVRARMLEWKQLTPQWQAGDKVLRNRERDRDPTPKLLDDLSKRVTTIEKRASQSELMSLTTWIAILALLVAAGSLLVAILALSSNTP